MNFKKRLLASMFGCVFGLMPLANALANDVNTYPATIMFSDAEDAKWVVHSAFLRLGKISRKLEKMIRTVSNAASGSGTKEDLSRLDLAFQSQKRAFDKIVSGSDVSFKVFNNLAIEFNTNENSRVTYYLPKITLKELGIANDDIYENADASVSHLEAAINAVKQYKVVGDSQAGSKYTEKLSLADKGDGQALESAVQVILNDILKNLTDMKELALQAKGEAGYFLKAKLNVKFQALLQATNEKIMTSEIGGIKMFKGNKLEFSSNDNARSYLFTKIDANTFNIKQDNLLKNSSAMDALSHLISIEKWVRNWELTGNAPVENTKLENHAVLALLPSLSLPPKDKMLLFKTYYRS